MLAGNGRQSSQIREIFQKRAHRTGFPARCALFCLWKIVGFPNWNLFPGFALSFRIEKDCDMLVERGLQVMNVESVGEAYAIASNYLRKTGAIADTLATNERLLGIIVQMFQRGEYNKIRLANKAISKFEAETLID
jgi:hypothetical protein